MSAFEILRWALSLSLAAVAVALTVVNLESVLAALLERTRVRLLPLAGGLAGALALLVCPLAGTAGWAWAPLVVDPGSVPALCAAGLAVRRARKRRAAEDGAGSSDLP